MKELTLKSGENNLLEINCNGRIANNNSIIESVSSILSIAQIKLIFTENRVIVTSTEKKLFGLLSSKSQSIQYDRTQIDYIGSNTDRFLLLFKSSGIVISLSKMEVHLHVQNKELPGLLEKINNL